MSRIVIGARGSALAQWQANAVRSTLSGIYPQLQIDMKVIRTHGDKVLHTALHRMPDKGIFTREIESALVAGEIDLAVHSLKDMPTERVEGLTLAAVTLREDPADVLVGKNGLTLQALAQGATVLTGSLRRRAQLLHHRRDLRVLPVRGNVGTRLGKLAESDAQAIVLARAGLARLGLLDHVTERLDPDAFLPACGQGALAIEIRDDDRKMRDLLAPLDDRESHVAAAAERAFLSALGGGCQVPIGAYAKVTDNGERLTLAGMVATLDGSRLLRQSVDGPLDRQDAAVSLGRQLADGLYAAGCQEILDQATRELENMLEDQV